MKFLVILLLTNTSICYGALSAGTVWEIRTSGASANGGGFVWLNISDNEVTYKWTAGGGGTDEYYCELTGGGDPSLTKASCTTDGTFKLDSEGSMDSLAAGEWDYGDSDTLGYSTFYVRLDDGLDPDIKPHLVWIGKGGGTDYSQQDAAQLTLTDGATSGIGVTTFTSATGGFTAAMVGNLLYLASGTNDVPGWYEIVTYTNTNTVVLDRAPDDGVGGVSGGNFKVGGALDHPNTHSGLPIAGNTTFIKTGTYAQQGANDYVLNVITNAGTINNRITFDGYKTTRGDNPTGTDRPYLDGEDTETRVIYDNGSDTGGFYWFKNLRIARATGSGIDFNELSNCWWFNVKVSNNGGDGFKCHNGHHFYKCESNNNSNRGHSRTGSHYVNASYIHDNTDWGLNTSSQSPFLTNSIIDTNTAGGSSGDYTSAIGCVYYNNSGATSDGCRWGEEAAPFDFINNIFQDNGRYDIARDNNADGPPYIDYSCFYGTGTRPFNVVSLAHLGDNNLYVDPTMTDPGAGDFTLLSGSPCLDAGMQVGATEGATGDYKWNIGVDQDDVAAGGSTDVFGWVD